MWGVDDQDCDAMSGLLSFPFFVVFCCSAPSMISVFHLHWFFLSLLCFFQFAFGAHDTTTADDTDDDMQPKPLGFFLVVFIHFLTFLRFSVCCTTLAASSIKGLSRRFPLRPVSLSRSLWLLSLIACHR